MKSSRKKNKILHTFETTAKADIPLKIPNQIPEKEKIMLNFIDYFL